MNSRLCDIRTTCSWNSRSASEEAVALYSEAEQAVVEEGYNLKFWVVEAFMRVAAWLSGEEMAAR